MRNLLIFVALALLVSACSDSEPGRVEYYVCDEKENLTMTRFYQTGEDVGSFSFSDGLKLNSIDQTQLKTAFQGSDGAKYSVFGNPKEWTVTNETDGSVLVCPITYDPSFRPSPGWVS